MRRRQFVQMTVEDGQRADFGVVIATIVCKLKITAACWPDLRVGCVFPVRLQ